MIEDVDIWKPWNEEEVTMERLKYIGRDPRLDFGEVYDCTVKREKGPKGPVNLSVHTSLHARVYLNYKDKVSYLGDWLEV